MANVSISRIEFDSDQAAHTPFPVTVYVDNMETVGPFSGPAVCPGNDSLMPGSAGHHADVTLEIRTPDGLIAWQETKEACIPIEGQDNLFGANTDVEFNPSLSPGDYSATATVQVKGDNGSDTEGPRSLSVGDTGDLNSGDGAPGGLPWSDGGAAGNQMLTDLANLGPEWLDEGLVVVGLIVVLVLLAPYADLANTAAGG